MIILIAFILIFSAGLVVIWKRMKASEKQQENELMQAYMISLESFYNVIRNWIELTRNYSHDLAKHIQTLEVMMQEKEAGNDGNMWMI